MSEGIILLDGGRTVKPVGAFTTSILGGNHRLRYGEYAEDQDVRCRCLIISPCRKPHTRHNWAKLLRWGFREGDLIPLQVKHSELVLVDRRWSFRYSQSMPVRPPEGLVLPEDLRERGFRYGVEYKFRQDPLTHEWRRIRRKQ